MNSTYIATFYSHFGAIRFKKLCSGAGWQAQVMPVPRDLSSSCGTCVRYTGPSPFPDESIPDEVEQVVRMEPSGYAPVYRAENS